MPIIPPPQGGPLGAPPLPGEEPKSTDGDTVATDTGSSVGNAGGSGVAHDQGQTVPSPMAFLSNGPAGTGAAARFGGFMLGQHFTAVRGYWQIRTPSAPIYY